MIQHGYFSGNHLGPARLHVEIARQLALAGFTTYRYDCYGVGDSDGSFDEVTYQGQVDDLTELLNWAHKRDQLVVVGHSAGCGVALEALPRVTDTGIALLLAPTIGAPISHKGFFSHKQTDELYHDGFTDRNGLQIRREYLESMVDPQRLKYAVDRQIRGKICFGRDDHIWGYASARCVADALELPKLEIADADHNFLGFEGRQLLLSTLSDYMSGLLAQTAS